MQQPVSQRSELDNFYLTSSDWRSAGQQTMIACRLKFDAPILSLLKSNEGRDV